MDYTLNIKQHDIMVGDTMMCHVSVWDGTKHVQSFYVYVVLVDELLTDLLTMPLDYVTSAWRKFCTTEAD